MRFKVNQVMYFYSFYTFYRDQSLEVSEIHSKYDN